MKVEECAKKNSFTIATTAPTSPPPQAAAPGPGPQSGPPAQAAAQQTVVDGNNVGYVAYDAGDLKFLGNLTWEERTIHGETFNYQEYFRGTEVVLINDESRNFQIRMDFKNLSISVTRDFDENRWERVANIECFSVKQDRSC